MKICSMSPDARKRIRRCEQDRIADGLDDAIAWAEARARQVGKPQGQIGGVFVTVLFGEGRKTRQVDEAEGSFDTTRRRRGDFGPRDTTIISRHGLARCP